MEQWPPTPQVAFANLATGDDTVAGYAGYGAISRWMMRQGHFVKMLIGSGVMLAAGILLALVFPGQINKLVLIVLTYGGLYGAMAIMIAGPNQTSLLQGAKKALNEHGKWQERYRHELTLPIQDPLNT